MRSTKNMPEIQSKILFKNVSDLLDLNKIKSLDDECLKLKTQIVKRKPTRPFKAYHARLGSRFWAEHFKWEKRQKRGAEKRAKKRQYKNRCPRRYEVYIKSPFWTQRKNLYYQKHGRACAVCGLSNFIQMHHIWYGNYGQEPDEQLIPFCRVHHEEFHRRYGKRTNSFVKETAEFLESYKHANAS